MKTTHVMMSTVAVAAALMTSTAWAQETRPMPMGGETARSVRESGRPLQFNYARQDERATPGTERVFSTMPLATDHLAERQRFADGPLPGNFSANITFDEVHGP